MSKKSAAPSARIVNPRSFSKPPNEKPAKFFKTPNEKPPKFFKIPRKIRGLRPEKFGGCVQENSGVGTRKIRGLRAEKFGSWVQKNSGVAYRKIRGLCMIIQWITHKLFVRAFGADFQPPNKTPKLWYGLYKKFRRAFGADCQPPKFFKTPNENPPKFFKILKKNPN